MKAKHPWIARLTVGTIMLLLAFVGVIITDIKYLGGWNYWKWIVPINAFLALWLSWYERKNKETLSPITLWHELLHWIGLLASILLLEVYVKTGLLSRSLAGLIALTMLSLTVFTIGIYVEWSFLLIGLTLGFFALIVAIAIKFFYAFAIPVLILAILILVILHIRKNKKNQT